MDAFEEAVAALIRREGLASHGARVLVACSGGADSTALLYALAALAPTAAWRLAVAHLDHGWRADGGEDLVFVRGRAAALGVPFFGARVDVAALPGGAGRSREETARAARRAYLERTAAGFGAAAVALGHTADDQAETVVLNLVRGAGTLGLGGMPPCFGLFVRPLLDLTRADVLAYLGRRGISWREDPTNRDRALARNRVRRELLPALEAVMPGAGRRLAAAAAAARAEEGLLENQTAALLAPFVRAAGGSRLELDGAWPAALPEGLRGRSVRQLYRRLAGTLTGLERRHVDAVVALKRGAADLPAGVRVRRFSGVVTFEREKAVVSRQITAEVRLKVPGITAFGILGWRIAATWEPTLAAYGGGRWDDVRLTGSMSDGLVVRTWRPGDRISPVGLNGSKKLQDLFVDAKVPRGERQRWPVVACGNDVVWVPGLALAASAAAPREAGAPAVRLKWERPRAEAGVFYGERVLYGEPR